VSTPPEPRPAILIVDDEPLNRDLLRRVLFRDYRVLEADHAEAALRVLDEHAVAVVLADQVMPGRSGTDLARDVRARGLRTVVLLLTGYEDAPEVLRALREGVIHDVVGKPWNTARLKELLARAVRLHAAAGGGPPERTKTPPT
jgi:two-component system response regulator HupR/HoxA